MNKQSKSIYVSLMNRIAIALMINQGLLILLSTVFQVLESVFISRFGDKTWVDMTFRLCECMTYATGFMLPVYLLNRWQRNAEKEIYEPAESGKNPSVFDSVMMLGIGLGITNLSAYLNYWIVEFFLDYSDFSEEFLWAVELDHLYQIIIYFVYSAIIPALVEELLFRGAICKALKVYGKGTAIVASAFMFAFMHANIEQLLYTFVAGLFLAWIYLETENLLYPILLHFINNGISVVLDIINEHCEPSVYNAVSFASDMLILGFLALGLVVYLVKILKGEKLFTPLKLKPDENGDEVAFLTVKERILGFASTGMIIFILYSLLTMISYIYLSTQV